MAKRRARIGELATQAGRSLDRFGIACLVTLIPAPTVHDAIDRGFHALSLSGLSPESMRAHYLLGDDDALLARVAEYAAAGVDHLILGCLPGSADELDEFFDKAVLIRTHGA